MNLQVYRMRLGYVLWGREQLASPQDMAISKNDGSRPRNVLTRLVYHSIYS